MAIIFDESVIQYVVQQGFDPQLGARHLERVIQKEILEPLAAETYRPGWSEAARVIVAIEANHITFHKEV